MCSASTLVQRKAPKPQLLRAACCCKIMLPAPASPNPASSREQRECQNNALPREQWAPRSDQHHAVHHPPQAML